MKSTSNKPGHVTKGDIFDDLGFSPAETLEMKIKVEIWQALVQHIEQYGFTQAHLVTTLKAHQPDVSNLLHGKISRISITKLIQFAARLDLDARVTLTSPKQTVRPPVNLPKCPLCGGTMRVVERFSSIQLLPRSPPQQDKPAA